MFKDKSIMALFPTNIWAHDLAPEVYEPLNRRLVQRIEELLSPRPDIGPGQTWQTRNDLQNDPAFAEFIALVCEAVDGVIQFLEIEPLPYEVTGCWGNVNPPGAPHGMHTHANNYLSGVYFAQTQKGADSITFFDPRDRINMIQPPIKRKTQNNATTVNVEARLGRLVVFPAWLRHTVAPNESQSERISISFNVMFSDFTKAIAKPLWTGIA